MAMARRVQFQLLEHLYEEEEEGEEAGDTPNVSLISHTHGRRRREERGILRQELQSAVKNGRKERANPSRAGEARWRYTHAGVVYITDETSRHEITSWRIDDKTPSVPFGLADGRHAAGGPSSFTSHTVLVVDHSVGSMRRDDIPGYRSRTHAVFQVLKKEFLQPQLALTRTGDGGKAVVSLILMSTEARVVVDREEITEELCKLFEELSMCYAQRAMATTSVPLPRWTHTSR